MSSQSLRSALATTALAALAAWTGCSSPQEPSATRNPYAGDDHHIASFEEARKLAADRKLPLLVDFYSPT